MHRSSFLRLNLLQRPGKLKFAKLQLVSNTGCIKHNIAFHPQFVDSGDVYPQSVAESLLLSSVGFVVVQEGLVMNNIPVTQFFFLPFGFDIHRTICTLYWHKRWPAILNAYLIRACIFFFAASGCRFSCQYCYLMHNIIWREAEIRGEGERVSTRVSLQKEV